MTPIDPESVDPIIDPASGPTPEGGADSAPAAAAVPAEDEPIEEVLWRFAEENGWLDKPRPPLPPRPPEPKSIHQMTPEEMHESLPVHLRRQRPDGTYYAMGLISRMQQDLEDLTQGKRAATYPEVDEYLGYALLAEGLAPRGLSAPDAVKWWRAGGSEVLSERPNARLMPGPSDPINPAASSATPGVRYAEFTEPHDTDTPAEGMAQPQSPNNSGFSLESVPFLGHPMLAAVNGSIDLTNIAGAGANSSSVTDPIVGYAPDWHSEASPGSVTAPDGPDASDEVARKANRDRLLRSADLLDLQRKRDLQLATKDPYSPVNLNLGVNQRYAEPIVMAAWKYALTPQALAAIIGAEADKGAHGEWKPDSKNIGMIVKGKRVDGSTASGLTQFKGDTWLDEGKRKGSYLNGVAGRLGYLDKRGVLLPEHNKAFLALRFDPEHSIYTAADYASWNIALLRKNGLILDDSPPALARYVYIMHHEGRAGGIAFLRGNLRVSDDAWNQNVPPEYRAALLAANGGNRNLAYRDHMAGYTDERINVRQYMVDSQGVDIPPTATLYRKAIGNEGKKAGAK